MRCGCRLAFASLLAARAAGAAAPPGFALELMAPRVGSFSGAECRAEKPPALVFRWSTDTAPEPGETETVFASAFSGCTMKQLVLREARPRTMASGVFPEQGEPDADARRLFDALAGAEPPCGGDTGSETQATVCVEIARAGSTETFTAGAPLRLDSKPPAAPVDVTVEPLDGALRAAWRMPSGESAQRYRVHVTLARGEPRTVDTLPGDPPQRQVTGLENGVGCTVEVSAFDDAGAQGNEGARSSPVVATPRPAEGFWERYRRMGGADQGGCGSAAAGLPALVALAGRLRRRRLAEGIAFLLALLLRPSAGLAAETDPGRDSVLRFFVSVNGAAFRPEVDAEPGLAGTPYADVFGSERPVLARLEAGAGAATAVGTLSAHLSAGRWRVEGRAREPGGDVLRRDATWLQLVPFSATLRWRGDFLARRGVPLVPFALAGWGLARWSTGRDATTAGGSGYAGGAEYGGGVELVLDALDPSAADSFLRDHRVRSTSLALEWRGAQWRGSGGLRLDGGGFGLALLLVL